MSEHEVLSGLPTGGLDNLFVPDPALDALFREAVVAAGKYGWSIPSRAEFEAQYKQEMAGKIQQ